MVDREQFDSDAARFLEVVQTGGPPPPSHFLGKMALTLSDKVRGIAFSSRLPPDVELDDVVQVVLMRLAKHPPSRPERENVPARATVLAWARTVTRRYIIDLLRMPRTGDHRLGEEGEAGAIQLQDDCSGQDERVGAKRELDLLARLLEDKYPRALPVYAVMREHGWLPSKQIAEMTGDSPANVDQIRQRMRVLAADLMATEKGMRP